MKIKISPPIIMIILLISIISLNWYINIDDENIIVEKKESFLKPIEIKKLQDEGIIKKLINPLKDKIVKSKTITYISKRTNIILIYDKDTIQDSGWNYYKYDK